MNEEALAHWGAVVPKEKNVCALIPCVTLTVHPLALLCPFQIRFNVILQSVSSTPKSNGFTIINVFLIYLCMHCALHSYSSLIRSTNRFVRCVKHVQDFTSVCDVHMNMQMCTQTHTNTHTHNKMYLHVAD